MRPSRRVNSVASANAGSRSSSVWRTACSARDATPVSPGASGTASRRAGGRGANASRWPLRRHGFLTGRPVMKRRIAVSAQRALPTTEWPWFGTITTCEPGMRAATRLRLGNGRARVVEAVDDERRHVRAAGREGLRLAARTASRGTCP